MNKKIISLLISVAMIFSTLPTVFAANNDFVTSVKNIDGTITVEGVGEKNEAVDIFVLNPGNTVADLNAADTDATFNAVVNYADVVYAGSDKLFKHTFEINNVQDDKEYVLYVKADKKEFTFTLKNVNIYVSTTGNDATGNGTAANPFATVKKAKEFAATQSKFNPVTIIIEEGEYTLTEGLNFTAADSGTEVAPVTFKAADGAKVTLTGAKKLNPTDSAIFTKVTDADILAKVAPVAKDNLYAINLEAAGLADVANFMSKHTAGNRVEPIGFYLNGDVQKISQWPNDSKDRKMLNAADYYKDLTITLKDVDTAKVNSWANADNAYLDGTFRYAWYKESAKIASISDGKITLKANPKSGVLCKKYYNETEGKDVTTTPVPTDTMIHIKNLLEEIDVPGEWYITPDAKTMYYYAPYTLTASDVIEFNALNQTMVSIKDCDYVTFDGIEFTKAQATAIYTNSTSDGITVKNCNINNVSGLGVSTNGTKTLITNNTIQNIGQDGVRIYNSASIKSLNDPEIEVSYNNISNIGVNISSSAMCGVTVWGSYGAVVKNNTVRNVPTTGIMDNGGPANKILNNEIYNVCEDVLDAGAVYKGRSYVSYDFTMRNNFIHDVGPSIERTGTHITGIYLDDLISGGIIDGNIIDVAGEWETYGIINCAGVDNEIKNNTVVNATRANIGVTHRDNIKNLGADSAYDDKYFYYQVNGIFETFLVATDYKAISDSSDTPDVNETTEYRNFALKNIGTGNTIEISGKTYTAPNWLPIYQTTFPRVMENYNKLIAGNYSKSDIVKDNVTAGEKPSYGHIYTPAALEANVTGNTIANNADSAIANALNGLEIGATADVLAKTEKEFSLVYPTNGATIMSDATVIKWQNSDFADKYEYKVYSDEAMKNLVTSGVVEDNYAEVTDLAEGTTYYWTVDAINESRLSTDTVVTCDEVFSFTKASYSFKAEYKADAGRIHVAGINNGEAKQVMMIATVKVGGELKGATTLSPNLNFVKGYNSTEYLSLTDEMKDALTFAGAELEIYIWDTDMKALTGKTKLN